MEKGIDAGDGDASNISGLRNGHDYCNCMCYLIVSQLKRTTTETLNKINKHKVFSDSLNN